MVDDLIAEGSAQHFRAAHQISGLAQRLRHLAQALVLIGVAYIGTLKLQLLLDARKAGFETYVIEDACRGIDLQGSLAKAWADMTKAGVKRIQSGDIAV